MRRGRLERRAWTNLLYWRLQKKGNRPQKQFIILDCMENLSLIEISLNGETYTITLKAVSGKVDLRIFRGQLSGLQGGEICNA